MSRRNAAPQSHAEADAIRRRLLDALHARYNDPQYLESDPLAFARAHENPADREVAALIAASFAFGNVVAMRESLRTIFRALGPRPAECLRETPAAGWSRRLRGFNYRWVRAADVRVYLAWLGEALRAHGSLGALWRSVDDPGDEDVLPALARWTEALKGQPTPGLRPRTRTLRRASGASSPLPSGAHLLLTSPEGGSACKRMNLFLRWVCRPDDGIDMGLWGVSPSRLLLPIDTHLLRAAKLLGMTDRTTADLRTAREVTAAFRRIRPDDPCRYDFALTRLGIMRLKEELEELRAAAGGLKR